MPKTCTCGLAMRMNSTVAAAALKELSHAWPEKGICFNAHAVL